jgi:hypothetical protein
MGAIVDRTVRCIVRFDRKALVAGALPIGNAFLFETQRGHFISIGESKIDLPRRHPDGIKTWLICRHFEAPDRFIANYLRHRYFVVFDSHVFCHVCNENNMTGGEEAFREMEERSSALSDKELQARIFDPFFKVNLRFGGRPVHRKPFRGYPRTWCVCNHLANEGNFRRHVFDGNLILFGDYKVTCPDCLDNLVKGACGPNGVKLVSIPDAAFQYTIVDTLYSLNYELSVAQGFIGHAF